MDIIHLGLDKKKEGNGKTQTTTLVKMHLDEIVGKFEKDYSLVSFLSTNTTMRSTWFLDSGASHHMTEAWEICSSLTERDLDVHVELGDDSKYAVKGDGIVMFHIDSGGSLDSHDVLYIPFLKNNFLSV
jgi:hypothetical protein